MNGHSEKTERSIITPARDMTPPTLDVAKRPNGVRSESRSESYTQSHSETQVTRRRQLPHFGLSVLY